MLELNQFPHSAFCLKVRMVLEAKALNYKAKEITPGIGQVAIFRLSGQRQVPVLVDGENVISDSTAIIRYIEEINPEPKLIPEDPSEEAIMHLIENWADTTLAKGVRNTLIQAAAIDPELRVALLPEELPSEIQKVISTLSCEVINDLSVLINPGEGSALFSSLEKLSNILTRNNWIVGNKMSFADIAVAAQLSLLRFPPSAGDKLAGKGCPGFKDHPQLEQLFCWRDALENSLMASSNLME